MLCIFLIAQVVEKQYPILAFSVISFENRNAMNCFIAILSGKSQTAMERNRVFIDRRSYASDTAATQFLHSHKKFFIDLSGIAVSCFEALCQNKAFGKLII